MKLHRMRVIVLKNYGVSGHNDNLHHKNMGFSEVPSAVICHQTEAVQFSGILLPGCIMHSSLKCG